MSTKTRELETVIIQFGAVNDDIVHGNRDAFNICQEGLFANDFLPIFQSIFLLLLQQLFNEKPKFL